MNFDQFQGEEKKHGEEINFLKRTNQQLKAQLDDAEHARTAALRAKRHCELEVEDTQQQLEEVSKS